MAIDSVHRPKPAGEVRSLKRGLEILTWVNRLTPASVTRIVQATALPKATVIRLLATLRQAGYISQNASTGHYEPLPAVRQLASAMQVDDSFAVLAARLLNAFGQRVSWPAELLMAESDAMAILASNRANSPIRLRLFEQQRFPMLRSAGGIAYLSALTPSQREQIVLRLAERENTPLDAKRWAAKAFNNITTAQQKGYSLHEYSDPVNGMCAVGVPVIAANGAVGSLVLLTLQNVVKADVLEQDLLPALRVAAQQLGQHYGVNSH